MVNRFSCYDEFLMAKFKPVKKGGGKAGPVNPGALPCVIIVIGGILLVSALFYAALSSGK